MSPGEKSLDREELQNLMKALKLIIFDVDGVLTDGGIRIGSGGEEYKRFHVRDGSGIKYLMRSGLEVIFVTGRESEVVERRAKELGVNEVHQKVLRKWDVVKDIIESRKLDLSQVAYMGDDLIDLPVMLRVGVSVAPCDAAEEVREKSLAVTQLAGGQGAVREFAEACLRAKGKWQEIVDGYLDVSQDS